MSMDITEVPDWMFGLMLAGIQHGECIATSSENDPEDWEAWHSFNPTSDTHQVYIIYRYPKNYPVETTPLDLRRFIRIAWTGYTVDRQGWYQAYANWIREKEKTEEG